MSRESLRLEAIFLGEDPVNHHWMLKEVSGDVVRDHAWLNRQYSNFPGEDIKPGSRVRFFASRHVRMWNRHHGRASGRKDDVLTDCREVKVLEEECPDI